MKNKQSFIIIIVIITLALTIGILIFINNDDLQLKKQLNNDAIFTVIIDGEEIAHYNMEEVQALGEVDFYANLKSSGNAPVEHLYTGVPLNKILLDAGVNTSEYSAAIVSAIDGYVVSVTTEKVLDETNVFIAYMRDGNLIGTREDDGDGPYQMIISKDPFSQYWCKYAYSVELK